jgi:phosphoenolpyruvate-protein kinase (PTS system EI component)
MNLSSVAVCKKIIGQLKMQEVKLMAEKVCNMETAGEIEAYLREFIKNFGV